MSRLARTWIRRLTLARPATRLYDYLNPLQSLGQLGERAAERFLLKQGMVIVARGYHDRFGEIDLIAVDENSIVFVEVKTRTDDLAGNPAEAVDENKQAHLTQTAIGYLKWHRLTECHCRFDVVAITWPDVEQPPDIRHYVNAFEPVGEFQMF